MSELEELYELKELYPTWYKYLVTLTENKLEFRHNLITYGKTIGKNTRLEKDFKKVISGQARATGRDLEKVIKRCLEENLTIHELVLKDTKEDKLKHPGRDYY